MQFGLILVGTINMKYFKTLDNNQPGLTLIELLLYIAIFSVIVAAIVAVAISATAQRVRNNAVAEVDYQGEALMSYITQTIRNSQSINSPGPNTTATSVSVNTPTLASNPTIFEISNEGSRNRFRILEGSPAVANYLTNNKVTVTNSSFANNAVTGGRDSIKIQFTIQYYNPSGRPELDYQKTFYGGVTLR